MSTVLKRTLAACVIALAVGAVAVSTPAAARGGGWGGHGGGGWGGHGGGGWGGHGGHWHGGWGGGWGGYYGYPYGYGYGYGYPYYGYGYGYGDYGYGYPNAGECYYVRRRVYSRSGHLIGHRRVEVCE